jgi:hypothetical protein
LRPWIREIEKASQKIKIHGHFLSPDLEMLSTLMAGMHAEYEAFTLALSMTEGLTRKNATRRMVVYDSSRKLTTVKKPSTANLYPDMSDGELKQKLDDIQYAQYQLCTEKQPYEEDDMLRVYFY